MGTDPQTQNKQATVVDTGIVTAVKAAEIVVMQEIIAQLPFLALPVLKQLLAAIIGYIGGLFSVALQNLSTNLVIDHQIGSEESGMSSALQAVVAAEKSGDPVKIKEALDAYAKAQSALVGADGSARPL